MVPGVPTDRDPFAQFERMRREMDDLFGNVFDRRLTQHHRRGGFSPAVDVYYTPDPPRAWMRADLAGIDPSEVALEIRGRELVLSGRRPLETGEQRVYQQLEIEHGAFRRVIALGVDVDPDAARAAYEDGILLVELPLARPREARTVPVQPARREGS
jgi:HSP20 family protein